MKLSTKCRYGLRAAIEIARYYQKGPAKRKDIAENQNLSDSYLENILIILKNNQIIETLRGVNGGFALCRPPSSITVLEIVTALEGPLNLVECVTKPDACVKSNRCATRCVWQELSNSWKSILSAMTLQTLLDKESQQEPISFSI